MTTTEVRNGGLLLGSHMSIAGGVDNAPARGATIGATAMQIFVKNNNRWSGPPITKAQADRFARELVRAEIALESVFAHAGYLINLASTRVEVVRKSVDALEDELNRCGQLSLPGLVIHPGAHLGAGREAGIEQIAHHCRYVIDQTPDVPTRVLFETTAGTGTNLGAEFEDLRDLLAAVDRPDRTGVCLDTCHIFAAGYEIRTAEGYAETMSRFEQTVGFNNLRAVHLNDSMHGLGSRKDRHEHIGEGEIGLDGFRHLINDPRFRYIPMSLETDKDDSLDDDRRNMATLLGLLAG